MESRFPIKVKDITITSEEYENTIAYIEEIKIANKKFQNLIDNLQKAGLNLPQDALECSQFAIQSNPSMGVISIIGR